MTEENWGPSSLGDLRTAPGAHGTAPTLLVGVTRHNSTERRGNCRPRKRSPLMICSIAGLRKSTGCLSHPSQALVTKQQLSAITSSQSLKTFVISCFLHFPAILIVSVKRQQLFSRGLSLEHIDSEQRMGASVCQTKEAASWGGLLCQGQQDQAQSGGAAGPPDAQPSEETPARWWRPSVPGCRRPSPTGQVSTCCLNLGVSVAIPLTRVPLKLGNLRIPCFPG